MVRKILAAVLITSGLVGVASLTAQHYDETQTVKAQEQTVAQQAAQKAEATELATAQAERDNLAKQLDKLRFQCQQGLNSYAKLPAYIQKVTPAPKCDVLL
jgi:Tfp pilus assembly protein PilV